MTDKEAEVTLYGQNRYILSAQEFGDLSNLMAKASMDSNVFYCEGNNEKAVVKGSYKENVFEKAGLHIDDDGLATIAAYKVEVDVTPTHISTVVADKDTYQTTLRSDMQLAASATAELNKTAAPTRMTFRPAAVRYELGKEDVEKLASTLSGLYNPETVYRVVSTNGNADTLGTLTNDSLFNMIGCNRLSSGNASMRDKAISLYRLENGFSIKIGSTFLLVATTAQPKFKEKDDVMVVVMHPDGNGNLFKGTVSKSNGYNTDSGDFMYDVTNADGTVQTVAEKNLQIVPETPAENQQSVTMNHF